MLSAAARKNKMLALAVLAATAGAPAFAQGIPATQAETFARMQRNPTDHDNTFAYVTASIEARDYEGAIAALERILDYNPKLTRAKYELGVLYFRLKSWHRAVQLLEEAQADPELDPALARRLDGYLPEARKQLSPSRFSGVLQLGYRFNSNVAGVPGSSILRVFGNDALVRRPFRDSGDGSAFALGELSHVYDFQNQRGDTWETRLAGYGTQQFRFTALNVALFEFSTGPRLALAPEALPGVTIRPYVSGGGSAIGGRGYGLSYGGGAALGIPLSPYFALEAGLDGQRIEINTPSSATNQANLSTGSLWTASLGSSWSVTEAINFTGKVFARRNYSDFGAKQSDQQGLEASVKIDFAPPTELIGMNWSVTPFVRLTRVSFDRPDPIVDPLIKRRDMQYRAGFQLDMPVSPAFGVNGLVQYTRNDSNIANFRSSSWSFLLGPTARF